MTQCSWCDVPGKARAPTPTTSPRPQAGPLPAWLLNISGQLPDGAGAGDDGVGAYAGAGAGAGVAGDVSYAA